MPNGTTVYARDVTAGSDPGPIFIVIDIPSEEYLDDFVEKEKLFAIHQETAKSDDDFASLILHFSPQDVIDTPVYREFMSKFADNTKHLVLNESNKYVRNYHCRADIP